MRCLSTPLQRSGDSGGLTDFVDMALKGIERFYDVRRNNYRLHGLCQLIRLPAPHS